MITLLVAALGLDTPHGLWHHSGTFPSTLPARPHDPASDRRMIDPEAASATIARGPHWAMVPDVDDAGEAVTLRTYDAAIPNALTAARSHRELEMLRALDGASTPRARGLTLRDGRTALVLEDLRGHRSLAAMTNASGPWELDRFFTVAVGIAAALAEVHQRNIIHRSLRPDYVLVGPEDRVLLIGLERATRMAEEEQRHDSGLIDATFLTYTSPEQTGRMNRPSDYRADHYSLGLVFYEMLTGALPFPGKDIVGTIHAHVAMTAPDVRSLRADVPAALGLIVAKLLAKSPEARYQNAFVLAEDLAAVATAWRSAASLDREVPSASDRSGRFVLSSRLYGREAAAAEINTRFERVAHGDRQVIFLTGYSGVGKTALVHETHRPLAVHRGLFVEGKFDQFGRITPYSALRRAFGSLIEGIAEDAPRLRERLGRGLQEELGSGLAVLLDILPELSLLVPDGTVPIERARGDSDGRFRLAFRGMVGVMVRTAPLVLFLDDLQWIDSASLRLFEELATADELANLLIIGAYRENEVEEGHPLAAMLRRLDDADAPVTNLTLTPLTKAHVRALIGDSFPCGAGVAEGLAEHIHLQTGGNPFFVRRLLRSLHDEALLRFDFRDRFWHCDLGSIVRREVSPNVVDLMVRQIRRLDADTVSMLELAACIGSTFELGTLAGLAQRPAHVVGALLWSAAEAGMIVLVSGSEWTELGVGGDPLLDAHASRIVFRFRHDRVQQTAYSLLAPERLPGVHLALCRLLMRGRDTQGRIFEMAGHCIHALGEIRDPAELRNVIGLVLDAAARAIAVNAASATEGYCRAVLPFLVPDAPEHGDLLFDARRLLGESQVLQGEFEAAGRTFADALAGPLGKLQRVALLALTMEMWVSQGEIASAMSTLVDILSLFGITIDASNVAQVAARASEDIIRARRGRTADEIVDGPEAIDPENIALLDVLTRASDTAYMSGREWSVATAALAIVTVLEHGVTVSGAMAFATYAVSDGEPVTAVGFARRGEYGRIGSMLADRFGIPAWIARANVSNAPHFDRSFRETVARFDLAATTGWESSALTWAAYAEVRSLYTMLVAGIPLDRIEAEREHRVIRIRRARRTVSEVACDALELFIRALRAPSGAADVATVADVSESSAALEARVARAGPWAACKVRSLQQLTAVIHGRWRDAGAAAAAMAPISHAMLGMTHEHWFHLFEAIRLANVVDARDPDASRTALAPIGTLERFLEARVEASPDHVPALHLARALGARLADDPHRAIKELNRAIEDARSSDQTVLMALAAEEAFRVARQQGWETLARFYLQEAHAAYVTWGAPAKAQELVTGFPTYFASSAGAVDAIAVADVESLLKSVRAISGELRIGDLLRRLVQIVLENAGAQRGMLVLERDGEPIVEAVGTVRDRLIETDLPGTRLDDTDLAHGFIRRVLRNGDALVLDDLAVETGFGLGRIPPETRPRSTLTMPIESQGRRIGALHLESWETTHAFRSDSRRALWLLMSQAVTAIENSRLYGSLEREVEERARTEMALRAERDYTANVFETLPLLACGVDADGRTVFVNPAVVRTLGRAAHELVGQSWWTTMHDRTDEREALRALLSGTGTVRDHDTTLRDASGHERIITWTCVPGRDGVLQQSQLLCFGADVTDERHRARDRKALEDQLRRSQQLETVGTLALGIAHDINNILTPISAYAGLLEEAVPPASDARTFVGEIQSASARAADLVRRILATSRKGEQARHPVLLQQVALEVCRLLAASLGAKVEIRTRIDADCPPVLGDASQVHQALLNLGANAGHAMRPDGGVLSIGVTRSTFPSTSARAGERCVLVSVSDTGHGIDEETAARIFDPFFTTKAVGEGTGLGLWVVHGVVQNAGGLVTVQSDIGRGTTFDLYFPTTDVAAPAAPSPRETSSVRGSERLLVIDDEAAILRLLQRALSSLGYRVTAFARGREALDDFRKHPDDFDLVLTDLTMPELDGMQVAQQLHALRPDLPILLMSGIGADGRAAALSAAGVRGTLEKPLTVATLGAAIRRVLEA